MRNISDGFEPEFRAEKPTKIIPIGSIEGIYLPKAFVSSFIFDKKIVFPMTIRHKGELKLAYFFDLPDGFDGKCYKIYRLKRPKGLIAVYLPLPKYFRTLLINSAKRPLVSYSFGFSGDSMVILLERYDGK